VKVSSILITVLLLILVISSLCIWFYPSSQDFMISNAMWNGTRNFLSELNASSIESLDDLPNPPEEAVLVAIPYLDYNDEELSNIKRFVDNGGTLLLMDDYGFGNSVLAYLGVNIRFTNKPLLDPLFYYKNPSLSRITDFAPEVKESDIDVIMLNHATTLTNVMDSEAIAWSSDASFLDLNENDVWDVGEPKGSFIIAAKIQLGEGIVAVVSDPSMIINSMVDRDHNYNFIRYLTRYEGAQTRMLVDYSHLSNTPLDAAKTRLIGAREALSSPYALLCIIAVIFISVYRFTLKKGGSIGK